MTISEPICLVIGIMLVGKACGFSEKSIMNLVKFVIGCEIIVNAEFIIRKTASVVEFAIHFFTKS